MHREGGKEWETVECSIASDGHDGSGALRREREFPETEGSSGGLGNRNQCEGIAIIMAEQ